MGRCLKAGGTDYRLGDRIKISTDYEIDSHKIKFDMD